MDKKTLEKLFNYLPVIEETHGRYGWNGMHSTPVTRRACVQVRTFFEYLQSLIPLNEIPELEEIYGDKYGKINLVWETNVDPEKMTYDNFTIDIQGDDTVGYTSKLESISTETSREIDLQPELCEEIIEHLRFFKRKQDEQRQVQKSTAS